MSLIQRPDRQSGLCQSPRAPVPPPPDRIQRQDPPTETGGVRLVPAVPAEVPAQGLIRAEPVVGRHAGCCWAIGGAGEGEGERECWEYGDEMIVSHSALTTDKGQGVLLYFARAMH